METIQRRIGKATLELVQGNLVLQEVDAIVNAANEGLLGGGGVDGAIHRAAGPQLFDACQALPVEHGRRCPTGEVRTTAGFELPARYVIHGVGPIYREAQRDEAHHLLRAVHLAALSEAVAKECTSLAFPAISTGAYAFPLEAAAKIALGTTIEFLETPSCLETVRFVLFDQRALDAFAGALSN